MVMINFSGLKHFDERQIAVIKDMTSKYYDKIKMKLPNCSLHLDCKRHKETGERSKYSFRAKLDSPSVMFSVDAYDWDLNRVLHKVFLNLEHKVKHEFRLEGKKRR